MKTPVSLDVYCVEIPMRGFEHAAASRNVSESIVTRVRFADGSEAFGQTLPRPYVTGETTEGVLSELVGLHWPAVAGRELTGLERLGLVLDSRPTTAAACALELALPPLWQGRVNFAAPITARVSAVLGSKKPSSTLNRLRLLWLYGLRDFKLKLGLGDDIDSENLRVVLSRLGKPLKARRATLRVDVNGGWQPGEVVERVSELRDKGVCVVEQPTFCQPAELVELAQRCELPLMADESLRTPADAQALLAGGDKVWWNLRLAKNGGIGPTLELAELAARNGVPFVVGCMVGESGILSAAQRRLLQSCPQPQFVEGNYGKLLLRDDLTEPSLRFGYGGAMRRRGGRGLGVRVSEDKLSQYGRCVATVGCS
jgi:muconate cycloisomerase